VAQWYNKNNKNMSKKTTLIVVAIIAVVIVIVAVVGLNQNVAKAPEVGSTGASTSTTQQATSSTTATSTMTVTISTSTPKTYSNGSFSFTYPGAWTIYSANPLLLANFNAQSANSVAIPAGGVQLTLVTTTISGNLDAIMAAELANATHLTTAAVTVNGVACAKATYQVNYAPGATVQNVSLYCSRGTELWKIYLSYPANDSAASMDNSEFNAIVSSMKLSG
jgi:hypothetical protein